jgi:ABC-type branched-subunit amino acid transport system ATPase component
MFEIKNLNKSFNGLQAVKDFSLSLLPNKITSLIGPNGAGKTTVFNIVTGYLTEDSGAISFNNDSIVNLPSWKIARKGISRTFQYLRLFRKLTVLENVLLARQNQSGENLFTALFTFSQNSSEHKQHIDKCVYLLEYVGLSDKQNDLAENLSYGQQKLLSIACCLAAEPKLLLLDEPVAGVQPAMIEKIITILKELVEKEKKTILLIEHNIDVVLDISDTIVVMDEGKKIAEDKPSVIRNNPAILEAYLS